MLNEIATIIGYLIIIGLGLCLVACLFWFAYFIYDYYVKRLIGWENPQVREDLFYFIKHKKEIMKHLKQARAG